MSNFQKFSQQLNYDGLIRISILCFKFYSLKRTTNAAVYVPHCICL